MDQFFFGKTNQRKKGKLNIDIEHKKIKNTKKKENCDLGNARDRKRHADKEKGDLDRVEEMKKER